MAEYRAPANVVPILAGKNMADMLMSGELAGAIGVEVDHPDVAPLVPDALEAGLKALRERGHYPLNHAIVIKDELLTKHPNLAGDAFEVFAEAKRRYLERLKGRQIEKPTAIDKMHERVMEITGDPLPYGIAPIERSLKVLLGMRARKGSLPGRCA